MESKSVKYASIGRRSVSYMIDDFVVSIFFIVIFYNQIVTLITPDLMLSFIRANLWVLFALKIIYHTFFIGYSGATLGKLAMGIKAVDENNPSETIGYPMALLRAIVREVGENLFYITFIYAFFSPKNQTYHDKISKCIVIDVR